MSAAFDGQQGHALTALMTEADPPSFPFLTLLISGGHSQLLLATGLDAFDVVVDTGTLPLGTCFDRLGAALGLEYGTGLGPALEQTAARDPPQGTALPELRALTFPQNKSPTFDFDGILASLQHELIRLAPRASAAGAAGAESPPTSKTRHDPAGLTPAAQIAVARAFQDAVGRVLVKKVRAVLDARRAAGLDEVGSLVVSGGVACNAHIRQACVVPPPLPYVASAAVADARPAALAPPFSPPAAASSRSAARPTSACSSRRWRCAPTTRP